MKHSENFKKVSYFGMEVFINKNHKFLAVDFDGTLYSYKHKPTVLKISVIVESWHPVSTDYEWVAEVNLEGLDWRETLVELE